MGAHCLGGAGEATAPADEGMHSGADDAPVADQFAQLLRETQRRREPPDGGSLPGGVAEIIFEAGGRLMGFPLARLTISTVKVGG